MASVRFDGMDLSYFNTYVDESEIFATPEKDYEFVEVPGLNGRLTLDNHRFKDLTIPINCFIRNNFEENFHDLMNFLLSRGGYKTLYLSQDPNHFRNALFYNAVKARTGSFNKSGRFTLNFLCKPERYLRGVEPILITQSEQTIVNPTMFASKPLLDLWGNGWFKFEMGSQSSGTYKSFTIDVTGREAMTPMAHVLIDCEKMICYNNDYTGAGTDVTLYNGYPVFESGTITCSYSSDSSSNEKMEIYPRWWEV